jgi:hypothetical protein
VVYAVMVYNFEEQGGEAHGLESEASRRHDEGANDAAPPRSEVLTRPCGRAPVFSATPTPLWASLWGIAMLPGQEKHAFACLFWAFSRSEVLTRPCGRALGFSDRPTLGGQQHGTGPREAVYPQMPKGRATVSSPGFASVFRSFSLLVWEEGID